MWTLRGKKKVIVNVVKTIRFNVFVNSSMSKLNSTHNVLTLCEGGFSAKLH